MTIYKSPAKINWYLKVFNKRGDGFHNIESVIQVVNLFDELIFEKSDGIEVFMTPSLGLSMQENIVYKTVLRLKELVKPKQGIRIHINKRIPSGAGLGGGSSNAATTLIALNELWGLRLGFTELLEIANLVGSDVPFFFYSPIACVRGKGDVLAPISIKQSYRLIIIKPDVSISTAWAYSQLKRDTEYFCQSNLHQFVEALVNGDFLGMQRYGVNDFEKITFSQYSEIKEIKEGLLRLGAKYAIMSGSGSCIFAVFEGNNYKKAYDFYSKRYNTWVVDTLTDPVYNIRALD